MMKTAALPAAGHVAPPPAGGLNDRARGWLKHLYRKATAAHGPGTADDWSYEGGASPHEWWDCRTPAPTNSWQRFDLHESSYAVALMSERTPAWREAYVEIMDGLAERYTTHWAACDWLTQFGTDPVRTRDAHAHAHTRMHAHARMHAHGCPRT